MRTNIMRTTVTLLAVALSATGCMRSDEPSATATVSAEVASSPPTSPSAKETPATVAPKLKVIGTEPFWGIDVDANRLHFTTMDDQTGRRLEAQPEAMDDGQWQWAGQTDGDKFALDVVRAECSDGMSDRVYAYTATFNIGQVEYKGCADDPAKFSGEGQ